MDILLSREPRRGATRKADAAEGERKQTMKREIIIGALAALAVPALVHAALEGISRYVNGSPPMDENELAYADIELMDENGSTATVFWYSFGLAEYVSLGTATFAIYMTAAAARTWLRRRRARIE